MLVYFTSSTNIPWQSKLIRRESHRFCLLRIFLNPIPDLKKKKNQNSSKINTKKKKKRNKKKKRKKERKKYHDARTETTKISF